MAAGRSGATRTRKGGDIDAYIASFPPGVRAILRKVRGTVRKAAPQAEEIISYRIPAFRQGGRILIYFAAFREHIGVFPPVKGEETLERALARFRGPKGSLRFPFDEPIPYPLIGRIVRLRVRQQRAKAPSKGERGGRNPRSRR